MPTNAELLQILLPPFLGAAIGYGTNDLAIRMLFRPYRAIYLFGRKLPFTPGMIPKEQERIARKVATTITTHLLTPDEIQRLSRRLASQENVTAQVDRVLDLTAAELAKPERAAAIAADLAPTVEQLVAAQVHGLVAKAVDWKWVLERSLTTLAIHAKEGAVRQALRDRAATTLQRFLDAEIEGLAARALEAIDVEAIIIKNINAFPPERVEQIIYEISKKELKGIIYLGGLLGFLVGCIQVGLGMLLR